MYKFCTFSIGTPNDLIHKESVYTLIVVKIMILLKLNHESDRGNNSWKDPSDLRKARLIVLLYSKWENEKKIHKNEQNLQKYM